MLPATRQSWASFQALLSARGLASLAIDLRGHGESTKSQGGVLQYQSFTDAQHEQGLIDVQAAYAWIRGRGIEPARIAVAGASIGANLALQFLAEEPQVSAAVLLSPGVDYHGVTSMDAAERLLPHQAIWMAASRGDDDESIRAMDVIASLLAIDQKMVRKLENHGHGTKMFDADAALMSEAGEWLRTHVLGV